MCLMACGSSIASIEPVNYYPFHLGDYAAHTAHLEPMEDLAYRRMLDLYYLREGALPQEPAEVARLIRMRGNVAEVESVLREFFTNNDGDGWIHTRCETEIASFRAMVDGGKRGAAKRWAKAADAPPMPTPSPPHTPPLCQPEPEPEPKKEIPSLLTQAPAPHAAERPLALVDGKPKKAPPPCPHLEVLALWAEVLPSMPQHMASQWRGARADHLRARWRETAIEKGWQDEAAGLAYLRKLFGFVGQSRFLTGRAHQRDPTARPFVIELEWLVNPSNWAKVIEGKYHQEAA